MPNVYLKKELYDEIVRRGFDVDEFVEEAVREALKSKKSG
jgi:post-segregation antitoxin (ccd killing protein)